MDEQLHGQKQDTGDQIGEKQKQKFCDHQLILAIHKLRDTWLSEDECLYGMVHWQDGLIIDDTCSKIFESGSNETLETDMHPSYIFKYNGKTLEILL